MKVSYDKEVDAAYLYLVPSVEASRTYCCNPQEVDGMINLDFDIDDRLIGIEVIPASKLLPASLLTQARD